MTTFSMTKSRNSLRNYHHHQQQQKKQSGKPKYLSNRMKRLRSDMEEISEEQKNIKEGQTQIREKFQAIELECEQLRKETNFIMQQSINTQIHLAFMVQILKARENKEFDKAAKLTIALRKLIMREDRQKETTAPIVEKCCIK